MEEITIEINIQNSKDRENVVIALANAGYSVIVETRTKDDLLNLGNEYFVIFDLKQKRNN